MPSGPRQPGRPQRPAARPRPDPPARSGRGRRRRHRGPRRRAHPRVRHHRPGWLGAEGETAAALRDRSLSALGGAGRGGESVAAVAWLGYDVPAGAVAVSTPDAARRGGADLARFYDGIDASRRADPHLTALGHSYGSLTTGYALQQAHGVDDAVVFGSPGIGTDHVGDLHVPPGHTGVVEAPWDPVADLGWFGDDPNRLDGVTGCRPAPRPCRTARRRRARCCTPST